MATIEHKNLTGTDLHVCKTHASTHAKSATDPLAIDTLDDPTDNTDLNVSTSAHGLCPKLPNDSSKVLNGIGGWTVPGGVPTGAVAMWPTETPPIGWLEMNGASISRTTYSDLFAVIGTRYGTVDASHFNLPDMRGYFPRGWDHGRGVDPDKATRTNRGDGTIGDAIGTKQAEDFKAHTHYLAKNATSSTSSLSSTNYTTKIGDIGWKTYTLCSTSSEADVGLTSSTGGNETRPLNINIMFIIKY